MNNVSQIRKKIFKDLTKFVNAKSFTVKGMLMIYLLEWRNELEANSEILSHGRADLGENTHTLNQTKINKLTNSIYICTKK